MRRCAAFFMLLTACGGGRSGDRDAAADGGGQGADVPADEPAGADAPAGETADAGKADKAGDAGGADTVPGDTAMSDGGPGDGGPGDGGKGGALTCQGDPFPSFDRSCMGDDDCAKVAHLINCCGSIRMIGIHPADVAAFDDAEKMCRDAHPAVCDCVAWTEDDEGTRSKVGDGSDIAVHCTGGACVTMVM